MGCAAFLPPRRMTTCLGSGSVAVKQLQIFFTKVLRKKIKVLFFYYYYFCGFMCQDPGKEVVVLSGSDTSTRPDRIARAICQNRPSFMLFCPRASLAPLYKYDPRGKTFALRTTRTRLHPFISPSSGATTYRCFIATTPD